MKRIPLSDTLLVALLLATCASPLLAQSGGSSYTTFNIGELRTTHTASGIGRGGVESAVPSGTIINSVNPAAWGNLRFVTIQASFSFEEIQISDASSSAWQNSTRINEFAIGFPISQPLGITISAGLHPYSAVGYRTDRTQFAPQADSTIRADLRHVGSGGLSEAYGGFSFSPIDEVAIGGRVEARFGSIDRRIIVDFPESNLNDAGYISTEKFSGLGGSIGLLVRPIEGLRLAAVYGLGTDVNVDYSDVAVFRERGQDDTISFSESEGTLAIPPRYTFGISYGKRDWLVGAEAVMQAWSGNALLEDAGDYSRYAIGAERLPDFSAGSSSFDKWALRAGAFMEQTYFALDQGDVDAMGLTLGASIPLTTSSSLSSGASIDLGLELGTRGNTDNGLTRELFGRFNLEFSISELWFIRSR